MQFPMAIVFPFRALRYNSDLVALPDVVTQPYDKITPSMQKDYYARSPFNLVRIILGQRHLDDGEADNVYIRAAAHFREWRRDGILKADDSPSLYAYTQTFVAPGGSAPVTRRGFVALGKLEDYSENVVFRHEQTLSKPKSDRLNLLRATRAHCGQIFMLYSDSGEIDDLLATDAQPAIEVDDEYGVVHRVWQVSDGERIAQVQLAMRDKKLIIADGHHRYETALNYRDERLAGAVPSPEADAPYERVMMTFVNMESPGLVILPTHRVVHGLPNFSVEEFKSRILPYFNVDEADPAIDAGRAAVQLREAGRISNVFLAVTISRAMLLHTPKCVGSALFGDLSLRQQELDVVLLHKCLLEGVLGISEEAIRNQDHVSYYRDASEALALVRSGAAQIAFLMNPCRAAQVRDIAFAGELLPQKSTDFFPKLLSGLAIYALE